LQNINTLLELIKVDLSRNNQFLSLFNKCIEQIGKDEISKIVDENGFTLAHIAARENQAGNLNILNRNEKTQALLNSTDGSRGFTPLHVAANRGSVEAVKELIKLNAAQTKSSEEYTPIMLTILSTDNPDSKSLLKTDNALEKEKANKFECFKLLVQNNLGKKNSTKDKLTYLNLLSGDIDSCKNKQQNYLYHKQYLQQLRAIIVRKREEQTLLLTYFNQKVAEIVTGYSEESLSGANATRVLSNQDTEITVRQRLTENTQEDSANTSFS